MAAKTFSFLLTTDNHLGFMDSDHIRRKDSYMAFEEALKKAREREVDFILLGGDLFHMNKPSAIIEHKCIKIIKQHMNAPVDRGTTFKRVSGNFSHFRKLNHANFEDPNLKVPFPIMTIHGNHDDPTGPNAKSICEKLATCGLLNYFGATDNLANDGETITIEPIVLEKDGIKLALYGLGFIPDHKLKAAIENEGVIFTQPQDDTFNILIVHQNRIPFNKSKYIPDELFPKFFHLIVRGHEHATQSPEKIPDSKVDGMVYQPGSTIATSISTAEAGSKKVGLISITFSEKKNKDVAPLYKMNYELINLKCCRPMIFRDITQVEIFKYIKETSGSAKVTSLEFQKLSQRYVEESIKSLLDTKRPEIESALTSSEGLEKLSRFRLPLVRIRLEYTSKNERFDEVEVNSRFYPSFVANKNLILFKKQQIQQLEGGELANVTFLSEDTDEDLFDDCEYMNMNEQRLDIDIVIEKYYEEHPEIKLKALSLDEYINAIRGSATESNVISMVLNKKKQSVLNYFKKAVKNGEDAKLISRSEEATQKWFLETFKEDNVKCSKVAGDEIIDIDDC